MAQKKWPETWQEVTPGCMIFEGGNSREYHTGSWRAQRPVWDNAKCIKCGICYLLPGGMREGGCPGLLCRGPGLLQGLRDMRPRMLAGRDHHD